MASILLTHAYILRFDQKQWNNGLPYPPLATLGAASVLRSLHHGVNFVDMMFAISPNEINKALELNPGFFVIYEDGFNYLTKMCLTNMRDAAFEMIGLAKRKGCTVIVSGSDSTDQFEKYLDAGADFILLGEAEQTLAELIEAVENEQEDLSTIKGMAFNKNNALVKTLSRPVLKNLDHLPLPAWDLLDTKPYRQSWLKKAGYFSLNIGTTRGCPYKCNWCAKPIYGNRYNARSPGNVISELKILKSKFDVDHIWFCDDIFGLKPGWVNEFARLVANESISIRFKIQSRADLLIDEHYVKGLAGAGCEEVWMGAESGSQKILDAMDKGITVEQVRAATELLKKYGIRACFFIQFGYPGETRKDISLTIEMINDLMPDQIGISISYPLPGTGFYEKVRSEMREKYNWTDSDEMALMFRNTYGPSFYKHLHRHVHKNYRKRLAVAHLKKIWQQPSAINWKTLKKALSGLYLIPAVFISSFRLKQLEKA